MNEDKVEVKEVKTVQDGIYLTTYDMLKSLFWHMNNKKECKGSKIENNSSKGGHEVGWKCSKCEQSWKISVRQLRNTIKDARLKEFGGYTHMNTFADLRKVLGKK